jgi:hypothetical protein
MQYFTFYLVLNLDLKCLFTLQPPISYESHQMTLVDPRTPEVTLRKGFCLILNFKDFGPWGYSDGFRKRCLGKTFSQLGEEVWTVMTF